MWVPHPFPWKGRESVRRVTHPCHFHPHPHHVVIISSQTLHSEPDAETFSPARHSRHLLWRQSGATPKAPRPLHRPHLHRPAVQLQSQLRGVLGRDQGEAFLRRPSRIHPGLHRVHAPPLRRTGARAQKDGQLQLSLRLPRQPLRQGCVAVTSSIRKGNEMSILVKNGTARWGKASQTEFADEVQLQKFFYDSPELLEWQA